MAVPLAREEPMARDLFTTAVETLRPHMEDMTPGARLLFLVMVAAAKDGELVAKLEDLSTFSGLKRSSVVRAVADLTAAGLLSSERTPGHPARYRLHLEGVDHGAA